MKVLVAVALIPLALAVPAKLERRGTAPIYDGSLVNGKTYDYVIAGGGLSGLVVAARLAEDGSKQVLVIEAGYNEEDRQDVYDASKYGNTFGTWLDWQYPTVPQSSADGRSQTIRGGRALGGSTCINGMAWSKPHDFQINSMEDLGNTGVNWNNLQAYMKKAEDFRPPSASQAANGITYRSSCHASNGPITVQYDPAANPQDVERDFNTTVLNIGLPYAYDLTCGNPAGASPIANTRSSNTRIDTYRGYLYQRSVPNLTILSGANVGKVILSSGSTPRATGLEFRDEKSNLYTVSASREVIMATGAIKTPVILQQSGIGPQSVLTAAGITPRIDLPVGLNLIDQTTTTTNMSFNANRGGGQSITFPRFQDLFIGDDGTNMRARLQNDLESYVQDNINAGASNNAAGLRKVLQIQRDWILNKGAGVSENFDYSFGSTLGWDSWYLLPFGRGSVKVKDNQAYNNNYAIDPRYFANPFDRLAQGATTRFSRRVTQGDPLRRVITGEQNPGGAVPDNGDLEAWARWSSQNYRSNWHPIGTAPMMSKDLGGVVDTRNRVYGVSGLRIVDASILPLQVSSHLMSVLYGFSERAADIIKQDNNGPSPSSSVRPSSSSAAPSSSSSATPTGRALHPNGDTSKCVEARGQSDGALIQIANCNGGANQRWTLSSGTTAVKLAGTNFCLDAGSNPNNGVAAKVWTCYNGLAAQTWQYGSDKSIKLASANECLDLSNGDKTTGNVLQTWNCFADNTNQKWTV